MTLLPYTGVYLNQEAASWHRVTQMYDGATPRGTQWQRLFSLFAGLSIIMIFVNGCSVKRLLVDVVGNALTGTLRSWPPTMTRISSERQFLLA